jgi:type VI secretion system secreted protein Hcp
MFLKIDGVEGESSDSKHKGEIELESFSWGLTQTGTAHAGGGAGAGKVQFQDVHFTKALSKASPVLFQKCATGERLKEAVLTARKAGDEFIKGESEFLKLTFSDVMITSYQSAGSQENVPVDQFSLNFAKIVYSVTTQDATGKPGETVTTGWDLRKNQRA